MDDQELIEAAKKAREFSYSPYSNFKVGAAVLTKSGKIYGGCNVENASYGITNCAERTAIFKAVSEGEREFEAIAIISESPKPTAPCGACRQVLAEFKVPKIIMTNLNGNTKVVTLAETLPFSFSDEDM